MKYVALLSLAAAVGVAGVGCSADSVGRQYVAPPPAMLMHPGPGVDGPGPGVLGGAPPRRFMTVATQVRFVGPEGMEVGWEVAGTGGPGAFIPAMLVAPGRTSFSQGAVYRLKLTNLPGHPGLELYPTLEVYPAHPKTDAFLAHNAVPIVLTAEDIDQVVSNNFVTKVIYLPDPQYQELAIAGVEELVSTRLAPGVDPVVEADRRGTILAVFRIGNADLETADALVPGGGMLGPGGRVMPASFLSGTSGGAFCPPGATDGCIMQAGGIAGVGVGPTWGTPITGTPIGLPGPPHLPLGGPAGLQEYATYNHTYMHIPEPVEEVEVHVQHHPGINLPDPVSEVHIHEYDPSCSCPQCQHHWWQVHHRTELSTCGPEECIPEPDGHWWNPLD